MSEVNDKPEQTERANLQPPPDSAVTKKQDHDKLMELQDQSDSPDTPSGILHRVTGKESVKLTMIDSSDSASMQEMQAINDPRIQQELELRRGIRRTMEPGEERDEAERITKEVMRAEELVKPTEIEVVKGDNLWRIARKHLGKEASNRDIANHVKNIVHINGIKNPDLIYPGERFKLPGYSVSAGEIIEDKLPEPEPKEEEIGPDVDEKPETTEEPEVDQKTKFLDQVKKYGLESDRLNEDLSNIEKRVVNGEISQEEIDETFKHANRLMEGGSKFLSQEKRNFLALEIINQAGNPSIVEQSNHNTCSVATIENRLYAKQPSIPAKLVADVALTGKYTDTKGNTVETNPVSKDPDSEKRFVDNSRSHASEIFQVTAVNLFHEDLGLNYRYVQDEPDISKGTTGEKLFNTLETPPKLIDDAPGLSDWNVSHIRELLTGENQDKFLLVKKGETSGTEDRVNIFASEQDLQNKLLDMKEKGEFPVTIAVYTAGGVMFDDIGGLQDLSVGKFDKNSRHVLNIKDVHMGPPPMIELDNQWGADLDRITNDKMVRLHDLFSMCVPPEEQLDIVKDDVAKDSNELTVVEDFEYIRLKKINGKYSSESDYETDVINTMTKAAKQWQSLEKAGIDIDKVQDMKMLKEAVALMPVGGRVKAYLAGNKVGIVSDGALDAALLDFGIQAQKRADANNLSLFRNLILELPSDRSKEIMEQFITATK